MNNDVLKLIAKGESQTVEFKSSMENDIEKYGSGIKRIFRAFEDLGAPKPEISEIGEGFRIVVYAHQQQMQTNTPPVTPLVTPLVTPPVKQENERESLGVRITSLISKEPRISLAQIAKKLDISRDTVKEYTTRLQRENRLRRVGKTSAGHWEVLDGD